MPIALSVLTPLRITRCIETETTETESEIGFDVRFDKLIEYKKGSLIETEVEDEQDEIEVSDGQDNEMEDSDAPEMEDPEPQEGEGDNEMEDSDAPEGEDEEMPEEEMPEGEDEDVPVAEARQAPSTSSAVDNAYQWDMDTVIQEWDITDWTELTPVSTSANGNLLTFSATALGGVAEFTFTISQSTEGVLSANSMKIDVTIEGFPWSESGTYIALLSHVDTENEVQIKEDMGPGMEEEEDTEDGDDEEASMEGPSEANVDFSQIGGLLGYETFGRYSWAPTAEATSTSTEGRALQMTNNIQVIATVKEGDEGMSKQDIAFSFVGAGASGAERIYWDPETGVGYTSETSASTTVGGAGSSAFALKAGALALAAIAAPVLLF